ncbi:hypothetical protein [Niastella populi]|uniref:Uncharacterized protein n=1 Tax=Niastella populi TaxID=550983 RepID=A0A1V9F0K8_9BACT|nr:hypothetical protein [Niastella populi]OQP51888.1 hypothetical protein A4R26_29150 [Niastella populi]
MLAAYSLQLTAVFVFACSLELYLLAAYSLQLAAVFVFACGLELYLLAAYSLQLTAVFVIACGLQLYSVFSSLPLCLDASLPPIITSFLHALAGKGSITNYYNFNPA